MKRVEWVDSQGRKRASLLRDADPDEAAPQGIPVEIPDIDMLDWEQIQTNLHNSLVSLGIDSWDEARRQHEAVAGAILNAVRRPLLLYLRSLDAADNNVED